MNVTWAGNLAFRQGLLFGMALGIFFIVFSVILYVAQLGTLLAGGIYSSTGGDGSLIGIVGFVVEVLVYLLAGMRASQQTGRVVTGTLAGLWTGLISSAITWVYTLIYMFASALLELHSEAGTLLFVTAILAAILGILGIMLALGLGAGIGTLGGQIGKRRASLPTQSFQPSVFSDTLTPPQNRQ